jgi:hypothetical protein
MSAPENFLQRWSRRKRAAAEAKRTAAPSVDAPLQDPAAEPAAPETTPAPAVDLESLPPVESITATTDVSGFLAPGVPPELTRAALRRAWLADPEIRDFIGLAENQWDFTAPHGVPGFGTLTSDEARRLVNDLLGDDEAPAAAPATLTSTPVRSPNQPRTATAEPAPDTAPDPAAAPAQADDCAPRASDKT